MKNLPLCLPLILSMTLPMIIASTGCDNLPIGAYSLVSDPLPDRAQLVTQDQYTQLRKSSSFYSISNKSIGEQLQAAARDERDNDLILDKFVKSHPGISAILPPLPHEPGVSTNPDGTYTHSCDGYTGNCSDSSHQMPVYCSDQGTARYCGFLAVAQSGEGFGFSSTSELWDLLSPSDSVARIAATVALGQPVVLAFNVTPSWDGVAAGGFISYKSGESNRGGHAVHVVGSIDNATLARLMPSAPAGSGGGYLIIKNSWSNCWSDGGFVYAPYDYVSSYSSSADSVTM